MKLYQLAEEWDNLTRERRKEALTTLFNTLLDDFQDHEMYFYDMVEHFNDLEADDYFGTEGLSV